MVKLGVVVKLGVSLDAPKCELGGSGEFGWVMEDGQVRNWK